MNDDDIEREIQTKGLTVPRVTLEMIERAIVREYGLNVGEALAQGGVVPTVPGGPEFRLTIVVLVLANGYTVIGESACVAPENFDQDLGYKIARQKAIDNCWSLFGFWLAATQTGAHFLP